MKKLKIALLSSVFALGLGQAAHAIYTQDQLEVLRSLIDQGDVQAILLYVEANPDLLNGEDPLAAALRDFVETRGTVLGRLFGAPLPDLSTVPDIPPDTTSEVFLASGSLSDFGS